MQDKYEPRAGPEVDGKVLMDTILKATANGKSAEVKRTTDGRFKVYVVEKHIIPTN